MEIRKLEEFEDHNLYSKKVYSLFAELAEKVDEVTLSDIRLLAEMTYKEGLRDGLRFMDWLAERTS